VIVPLTQSSSRPLWSMYQAVTTGASSGVAAAATAGALYYARRKIYRIFSSIVSCICCILCCLCFVAPVLIIVGFFMSIASTQDTRTPLIHAYNEVVGDWTNTYRPSYALSPVSAYTQASDSVVQGTTNTTDDAIDDSGAGIDTYVALKYSFSGGLVQSAVFREEKMTVVSLPLTVSFNSTDGIMSSSFNYSMTPFQVVSKHMNSTTCASNNGGTYRGNNVCNFCYKVTDICVKISGSKGVFTLSNEYGGDGCYYNDVLWGNFLPETYALMLACPFDGQSKYLGDVMVTVRSEKDPFVFLENQSKGNLNFGLTQGQKLALGLFLMVLGCCIWLPVCLLVPIVILVIVGIAGLIFALTRKKTSAMYVPIPHESNALVEPSVQPAEYKTYI
jgi:hypothetical protein